MIAVIHAYLPNVLRNVFILFLFYFIADTAQAKSILVVQLALLPLIPPPLRDDHNSDPHPRCCNQFDTGKALNPKP